MADGTAATYFVDQLAELLGVDIAASTDLTGHSSLGGDWELEYRAGEVVFSLPVAGIQGISWEHLLQSFTVADNFATASYGNNDGTSNWSANWSENDGYGLGASGGSIQISAGALLIRPEFVGNSISRQVDLSGAQSATLSFTYNNGLAYKGPNNEILLQISANGGAGVGGPQPCPASGGGWG
jgi:hypothetical protein